MVNQLNSNKSEPQQQQKQQHSPPSTSSSSHHITSKFNHVFTAGTAYGSKKWTLSSSSLKSSYLEKMLNRKTANSNHQVIENNKKPLVNNNTELPPGTKRNVSTMGGFKNNGTYIIFGADSSIPSVESSISSKSLGVEAPVVKKLKSMRKRHKKLNPTFLRRRLLSFNDIESSER